jgi:type IV secretion system protein VirB1
LLPGLELLNCQNMAVSMDVMQHVVHVESSYNPYAIGVVGGRLVRQPKNLPEALATVRMLESSGYNFSLGLAQVNRFNLSKYGLESYEKAFQECPNLQAGSRILADCYKRLGGDWGKSFSCYYSGNSVTGFRHGYVQKIFASIQKSYAVPPLLTGGAIAVVSKPSRKVVGITRHPLYSAPLSRQEAIIATQYEAAPTSSQPQLTSVANSPLPTPKTATPLTRAQRIIASYNLVQTPMPQTNIQLAESKLADSQIQLTQASNNQPLAYTVVPTPVSAAVAVTPVTQPAAITPSIPSTKNSAFVF